MGGSDDRGEVCERHLIEAARRIAATGNVHDATMTARPEAGRLAVAVSDLIPGYTLLRELSRGGQGIVYQAIQRSTHRKVAVKVLKEGPFADSADLARFEREVQVLGSLKHPNIVTIHDSGSAAGQYYLVMDYIAGHSLDVYMASGSHTVRDTLTLFVKICDAVNAAHLRGVIHRDLKPANIRVDESDEPHVLDFGLAKVSVGSDERAMTMSGEFVGSVPWSAPEQTEGRPEKIDVRTDVYALGVILYQMLTGRFPYDVVGNVREVLDRIAHAEPVRPRLLRREVDDEIETIILKCLAKERDRRYQAAGELARDIRNYLTGEPIEAKRDSGWYVMNKYLQRNRASVAIAAGFLLLLVGGAVATTTLWLRAASAENRERSARLASQRMLKFQSGMLTSMDPLAMSEQLRDDLRNGLHASIDRLPDDAGDDAALEQSFDVAIARIDLTGIVASLIDKQLLSSAAETLDETFRDEPYLEIAMRHQLATILSGLGRPQSALPHELRVLDLARELTSSANRNSGTKNDLGYIMNDGLEPEDLLIVALNDVGLLHLDLGNTAAAEPPLRESLHRAEQRYGDQDVRILKALDSYAAVMTNLGRREEAEQFNRRSYQTALATLGPKNETTLLCAGNFAIALKYLGRLEEAEHLQRAVARDTLELYGRVHPRTSSTLSAHAATLHGLGRMDEAHDAMQEALEISRTVYGKDHPITISSLRGLAHVLRQLRRHDEAREIFESVLRWRHERLGPRHPHTLDSLEDLAHQHQIMGDVVAAAPLLRDWLAGRRVSLSGDQTATLVLISNLGRALRELGRLEEADEFGAGAVELARRLQSNSQGWKWHLGAFLSQHAQTLMAMRRYSDAEWVLLEAHQILAAELSDYHERAISAARLLVELYETWHQAAPDEGYAERAIAWRERLTAPEREDE